MSRKNKTLRAFLHQNDNPTIEQAWDHAWKGAQKEFHARSMQDMEAKIDRLTEALEDIVELQFVDAPQRMIAALNNAASLLAQLDAGKGGE